MFPMSPRSSRMHSQVAAATRTILPRGSNNLFNSDPKPYAT
jgi:hypothetical protein